MKIAVVGMVLLTSVLGFGQNLGAVLSPTDDFTSNKASTSPTSLGKSDYRIGSNDQLEIDVFGIMELDAAPRVSASGTISLKMIGTLQAGGLTPPELERAIEQALKAKDLVNDPHVTVRVHEYASQPVSVMGAVRMPNIYQIKGEKTLFSMIAQAQGLDPNTVGSTIQVIRAPNESESERQVITIDIADFQRGNVALDIPIYANDMVNVQAAESVFTVGELMRPDEFVLRNGKNISVLQAISKSGGPTKDAKMKAVSIVRYHKDGTHEEIPVDFDKIVQGKADDIQLMPNDILFVPPAKIKAAINKALSSTVSVVTGRLVYGF